MKLIKIINDQFKRLILSFETWAWGLRFNSLIDRCSETGGENSPYFEELQEHIKKDPKKYQK